MTIRDAAIKAYQALGYPDSELSGIKNSTHPWYDLEIKGPEDETIASMAGFLFGVEESVRELKQREKARLN